MHTRTEEERLCIPTEVRPVLEAHCSPNLATCEETSTLENSDHLERACVVAEIMESQSLYTFERGNTCHTGPISIGEG